MQHDFLHRLLPSHLLSQFHMEKKREVLRDAPVFMPAGPFSFLVFCLIFFLVSVFFLMHLLSTMQSPEHCFSSVFFCIFHVFGSFL